MVSDVVLAGVLMRANGLFSGRHCLSGLRSSLLLWAFVHEGVVTNANELARVVFSSRMGVVNSFPKLEDLLRVEVLPVPPGRRVVPLRLFLLPVGRALVLRALREAAEGCC